MGKLVFMDECLVPRRLSWLNYAGPDPIGFLKDFKTTLRFIFEVSTTRCRERKLLWDYTGDPIHFYDEWMIKKELSRFSDMWVSIRVRGYVNKAKKDGNFTMELYGEVQNKFSPSNWFTKYVWLIYNYMFYNKIRERYVQMCRDYINKYLNWCKEKHNLKTVTTPEAEIEEFEEEGITHGIPPSPEEVEEKKEKAGEE
jgi:hypothetical protein